MVKRFEGEGNPSEDREETEFDRDIDYHAALAAGMRDLPRDPADIREGVFAGPDGRHKVYLSPAEVEALAAVLHRDHTSRPSYDGLRQLLSLDHPQAETLLALLRRICS